MAPCVTGHKTRSIPSTKPQSPRRSAAISSTSGFASAPLDCGCTSEPTVIYGRSRVSVRGATPLAQEPEMAASARLSRRHICDEEANCRTSSWWAHVAPARQRRCCWRAKATGCFWSIDRRFRATFRQGHFIHRHGPRRLREWGLLDRVVATGCPPSTTITLDTGDSRLVGKDLVLDGVAAGYGPRRGALDQVLIDAAVAAGVHLREGFAVEEYVSEGDRIVGIAGRDRTGGAPVTERAILTVGADGRGSRLARTVQAPEYERHADAHLLAFLVLVGGRCQRAGDLCEASAGDLRVSHQ